jgi:hypothetical protein
VRYALPYGTWPIPGEFYRDYIAAWLGPILKFTFAQQRYVNAWIIAQYGLTRQEVEGVPELDWLRMLLARGCPLGAFAYLVEDEDSEKLLKFVDRRAANDDESKLGTFQFDATAAWIDKLLRKWDSAQLPNDAQFIATFPKSFHFSRSDDYASQTRLYAFADSYRVVEGRTYDQSDAGRPIVDCIYIAGYASNGQYHTGLIDQRDPAEQRSAIRRPSVADSSRGANLSALRTSLPQATFSTYVESMM